MDLNIFEQASEQARKTAEEIEIRQVALARQKKQRAEAEYYKTVIGKIKFTLTLFFWWQGMVYGDHKEPVTRMREFLNDTTAYKDDAQMNQYRALFRGDGERTRANKRKLYELMKVECPKWEAANRRNAQGER